MGIKNAYVSMIIVFLGVFLKLESAAKNLKKETFLEKYGVSADLKERCDALFSNQALRTAFLKRDKAILQECGFILYPTWKRGGSIVAEHQSLPGWIFKGEKRSVYAGRNLSRLHYAHYMKTIIKKCNYDCLAIVKEYLYHIPERGVRLSGKNYLIVSKKVSALPSFPPQIPSHVSSQIHSFIKKVGYWDAHRENIVFTSNKAGELRAVFIDTEPFPSFSTWMWQAVRPLVGKMGIRKFKQSINAYFASLSCCAG